MILYLFFVLESLLGVMFAPATFERPFLVMEMLVFLGVGGFFLWHKIKRNGLFCFDAFFIAEGGQRFHNPDVVVETQDKSVFTESAILVHITNV
jgi:hypothetical protein